MRTDGSHSFQSSVVTCTCELPCVVMLNCDGCFFCSSYWVNARVYSYGRGQSITATVTYTRLSKVSKLAYIRSSDLIDIELHSKCVADLV